MFFTAANMSVTLCAAGKGEVVKDFAGNIMSKNLTNSDYCRAAKQIGCDVAAVKAVAQVESNGGGFLPDGRCKILFERHWFHKFTKGRFDNTNPQISSVNPGGYWGNEKEYYRFNEAMKLDPKAALMSCSWGKFQIMAFNYALCGFTTVNSFVDAMRAGEAEQLEAFLGFIEHNDLTDEMRRLDWRGFARGYNGKAYEKNDYHNKLARAFNKFKQENINCNQFANLKDEEIKLEIPINNQIEQPIGEVAPDENKAGNTAQTLPQTSPETTETATVEKIDASTTQITQAKNEQDVNQPAEVAAPEPQGIAAKLKAGIGTIFGGTIVYTISEKFGAMSFSTQAIILFAVVAFIALLGFCFWAWLDAWKQNQKVKMQVEANTDIAKKDLIWK
jgi:hypothetical protein